MCIHKNRKKKPSISAYFDFPKNSSPTIPLVLLKFPFSAEMHEEMEDHMDEA